MRFADAGYAVFRDDAASEVSWDEYKSYLEQQGKNDFKNNSDPSEYPYKIEVEFGDSKLILTTTRDRFVNRIVRFGDMVYTDDGALKSFNLKKEYYMHYDINNGEVWGDVLEYEDGFMVSFPFSVDADKAYGDYVRENIDALEAHSFGDGYPLGLGKLAFANNEVSAFYESDWYLNPFGNNFIKTSLPGNDYLDYSSYSADSSRRYSIFIASGGSFVLDGDSNTFGKSTTTTTVNADYSYVGTAGNDRLLGSQGANGQSWAHDFFDAGAGDDFIGGGGGRDVMKAGLGNDELRGGYGHDVLDGGAGEDILYGGGGRNTFNNNDDGDFDQLFVLSDYHAHNYEWGRLHKGANADTINSLGEEDHITILGVATDELSIRQLNDGLGIFASGSLEAIVTDSSWSTAALGNNVFGDASRFW